MYFIVEMRDGDGNWIPARETTHYRKFSFAARFSSVAEASREITANKKNIKIKLDRVRISVEN